MRMAGGRFVGNQAITERRKPEVNGAFARWYGSLDAMAPYLIMLVAVAIARHPFTSTMPAALAVVGAALLLAGGAGASFFWDMSASHLTWPVAFVILALLIPFLTLHTSLERSALDAPAPVHLLPLVFTWTGTLIAALLVVGCCDVTVADQPNWAGVVVTPVAVLVGSVAATSLNLSRGAVASAILSVFAIAAIAAGVGWLLPERYRWFLILAMLAIGALTIARSVLTTPHHLPGRWLLLGDAALASAIGLVALGSPLFCRWLTSQPVTSSK